MPIITSLTTELPLPDPKTSHTRLALNIVSAFAFFLANEGILEQAIQIHQGQDDENFALEHLYLNVGFSLICTYALYTHAAKHRFFSDEHGSNHFITLWVALNTVIGPIASTIIPTLFLTIMQHASKGFLIYGCLSGKLESSPEYYNDDPSRARRGFSYPYSMKKAAAFTGNLLERIGVLSIFSAASLFFIYSASQSLESKPAKYILFFASMLPPLHGIILTYQHSQIKLWKQWDLLLNKNLFNSPEHNTQPRKTDQELKTLFAEKDRKLRLLTTFICLTGLAIIKNTHLLTIETSNPIGHDTETLTKLVIILFIQDAVFSMIGADCGNKTNIEKPSPSLIDLTTKSITMLLYFAITGYLMFVSDAQNSPELAITACLVTDAILYSNLLNATETNATKAFNTLIERTRTYFKKDAFGEKGTVTPASLHNLLIGTLFPAEGLQYEITLARHLLISTWQEIDNKEIKLAALEQLRSNHRINAYEYIAAINLYTATEGTHSIAEFMFLTVSYLPPYLQTEIIERIFDPTLPHNKAFFCDLMIRLTQPDAARIAPTPQHPTLNVDRLTNLLITQNRFWMLVETGMHTPGAPDYHTQLFERLLNTPLIENRVDQLCELTPDKREACTALGAKKIKLILGFISKHLTPRDFSDYLNASQPGTEANAVLVSKFIHEHWEDFTQSRLKDASATDAEKAVMLNTYLSQYSTTTEAVTRVLTFIRAPLQHAEEPAGVREEKVASEQKRSDSLAPNISTFKNRFLLLNRASQHLLVSRWLKTKSEPSVTDTLSQIIFEPLYSSLKTLANTSKTAAIALDQVELHSPVRWSDDKAVDHIITATQRHESRPHLLKQYISQLNRTNKHRIKPYIDHLLIALLKKGKTSVIDAIYLYLPDRYIDTTYYFNIMLTAAEKRLTEPQKNSLIWLLKHGADLRTQSDSGNNLCHVMLKQPILWTAEDIRALPDILPLLKQKNTNNETPEQLSKYPNDKTISLLGLLLLKARAPDKQHNNLFEITKPIDIDPEEYDSKWTIFNTQFLSAYRYSFSSYKISTHRRTPSQLVTASIPYDTQDEKTQAKRALKHLDSNLATQGSHAGITSGGIIESAPGTLTLSFWIYSAGTLATSNLIHPRKPHSPKGNPELAYETKDEPGSESDSESQPSDTSTAAAEVMIPPTEITARPADAAGAGCGGAGAGTPARAGAGGRHQIYLAVRGSVAPPEFAPGEGGAAGAGSPQRRQRHAVPATFSIDEALPPKGTIAELLRHLESMGLQKDPETNSYQAKPHDAPSVVSNDLIYRTVYRPGILAILQNLSDIYKNHSALDPITQGHLKQIRNGITHYSAVSTHCQLDSDCSRLVFELAANCLNNHDSHLGLVTELLNANNSLLFQMNRPLTQEEALAKFKESIEALKEVAIKLTKQRPADQRGFRFAFTSMDRTPELYALYHHTIALNEAIKHIDGPINRLFTMRQTAANTGLFQVGINLKQLTTLRNRLAHDTDQSEENSILSALDTKKANDLLLAVQSLKFEESEFTKEASSGLRPHK
jgi:hypothetical protein